MFQEISNMLRYIGDIASSIVQPERSTKPSDNILTSAITTVANTASGVVQIAKKVTQTASDHPYATAAVLGTATAGIGGAFYFSGMVTFTSISNITAMASGVGTNVWGSISICKTPEENTPVAYLNQGH